jgi:hypothetical protein
MIIHKVCGGEVTQNLKEERIWVEEDGTEEVDAALWCKCCDQEILTDDEVAIVKTVEEADEYALSLFLKDWASAFGVPPK